MMESEKVFQTFSQSATSPRRTSTVYDAPLLRRAEGEAGSELLSSVTLSGMDYLWTPWRYAYVSGAGKASDCIFCELAKLGDDRKARIIYRGQHCFILLNTFPYTSGHVMIAPYEHVDQLAKASTTAAGEMMALSQRVETALRTAYHPDGINLGMNIGAAAGAGVAGHIHMHMLPRWVADSNFMTTVGETRVVPEDLGTTYDKLKAQLAGSGLRPR